MKKFNFVGSVFQTTVGLFGVVSFVILCVNGESTVKWLLTCLLSVLFLFMGVSGIVTDIRNRKS